jgi:uncharacterized protein (DUF433 family)
MDAGTMTLQIPAGLYARLQSLAAKERTDPAQVVERLVDAAQSPPDKAIIRDPQLRGGRPIIAGTGVTVRTIVGHYKLGLTPEETADEMSLDLASVYAALAYYHLHRDEIEADILADSEERVMREFGA